MLWCLMKECSEVEGDKQEGGGGWVCMDHDASLWTTMAAAVVRFWKIASFITSWCSCKILASTNSRILPALVLIIFLLRPMKKPWAALTRLAFWQQSWCPAIFRKDHEIHLYRRKAHPNFYKEAEYNILARAHQTRAQRSQREATTSWLESGQDGSENKSHGIDISAFPVVFKILEWASRNIEVGPARQL